MSATTVGQRDKVVRMTTDGNNSRGGQKLDGELQLRVSRSEPDE